MSGRWVMEVWVACTACGGNGLDAADHDYPCGGCVLPGDDRRGQAGPGMRWRAVRPSVSGEIYTYETEREAERMLRMCYPLSTPNEARTRRLTDAECKD